MHSANVLTKSSLLSRACKIKIPNRSSQISCTNKNLTKNSRIFNEYSLSSSTVINKLWTVNSRNTLLNSTRRYNAAAGYRFYCAGRKDDEGGDTTGRGANEEEYSTQLPATVAVPEVWPHLPVIAINRNIVFPRFIKLIEVGT